MCPVAGAPSRAEPNARLERAPRSAKNTGVSRWFPIACAGAMALAGCVDPIVIGSTGDGVASVGTDDVGDGGGDLADVGDADEGDADVGDEGDGGDDGALGPGCGCGPVSGLILVDDVGSMWRFEPEGIGLELLGDVGCDERFGPRPAPVGVAVGSNGESFVLYPDDALFRVPVDDPASCEVAESGDEVFGGGGHDAGPGGPAPRTDIAHVDAVRFGGCGAVASVRQVDGGVVFLERWIPATNDRAVVAAFPADDARVTAATDARLFVWLLRDDGGSEPTLELIEVAPEGGDVLDVVVLPGIGGLWAPDNALAVVTGPEGRDEVLIFAPRDDGSSSVIRASLPEADGQQPQVELVTDDLPIVVRAAAPTPCHD